MGQHAVSAGILLYRRVDDGALEVLLGHPGGPYFVRRDEGVWSIPKGEAEDADGRDPDAAPAVAGEPSRRPDLLAVARREFEEETGHAVPVGSVIVLGTVVQRSGKIVHAWAVEGDLDPDAARSNTFALEWPPGSGRISTFPEIDRVAWLKPDEARRRINGAQAAFIDRLEAALER